MKKFLLSFFLISPLVIFSQENILLTRGPSQGNEYRQNSVAGFIENKGQIMDQNLTPNPVVKYLFLSPGFNVQIRENGFSYDLYDREKNEKHPVYKDFADSVMSARLPQTETYRYNRIDIDFIGINSSYEMIPSEKLPGVRNYYTTGTPAEGVTGVCSYKTITSKNIYPGIDLELISDGNKFKYNLILSPGADLSLIRMKIAGPACKVNDDGSLLMSTSSHKVTEEIPSAYYLKDGQRTSISYRFIKSGNDIFSLKCEQKVPSDASVVIDPIPARIWGTYFGDVGNDAIRASTIDHTGKVVYTGNTSSIINIATAGVYQTTYGESTDAFLATSDANSFPVWSTYFGGEEWEMSYSVCSDATGAVYIAGQTSSTMNIASPGAFLDTLIWASDAFLAKFTSNGQREWSTYYGGNSFDIGESCAVDNAEHVYLTGETNSDSGIATPGSFQPIFTGNSSNSTEGFIVQFSSSGARIWGTYYGGNLIDDVNCISIDNQNNIVVGGFTSSPNNIATPGAFQTSIGNTVIWNLYDGYVAKFNSSGSRLWSTYYGGENWENVAELIVDLNNNIIITGRTNSVTNIASPGSYQPILAGVDDVFLAKFSPSGARQWGTYAGGTDYEQIGGIASKNNNDILITGTTRSTTGIATSGAFMSALSGLHAAFLMKFTSSGGRVWGTYYGDTCSALSCSCSGDTIYAGGATNGHNHVATPGAWKTSYSDSTDAFIVKFIDCNAPDSSTSFTGPNTICVPSSAVFSIAPILSVTGYQWEVPPGATITSGQNSTSITVDFGASALSGYVYVSGQNNCWYGEKNQIHVRVLPRPIPVITGSDTSCPGFEKNYTTDPGKTNYTWFIPPEGTVTGGGTTSDNWVQILWNIIGSHQIKVNYTETNGCNSASPATLVVTVGAGDTVDVSIAASDNNICTGTPVTFTATPTGSGTLTYQWKVNGMIAGTNSPNFNYSPLNNDVVCCVLTSSNTVCVSNNPATSNAITMVVNPLVPVTVSIVPSQNNVCQGTPVTFTATPSPLSGTHNYQWTVNGINSGADQSTFIYTPNNNDVVACSLNVSGLSCLTNNPDTSQTVTMNVNPQLTPVVTISALPIPPVCGNISLTFTAHPVNGGITPAYQWFVNGNPAGSGLTYSFIPANNDLVVCSMNSSARCPTVNPVTSIPFQVPVITTPVVTYTLCTDSVTTLNAKPFKLKGGLPLGGTYSGPGVNSLSSIFTPSIAGVGTKTISYSYTNAGLCSDAETKNIIVQAPAAFLCGNLFTDIRDTKTYKTIQIGSQCWFAENLNFGTEISSNQHQRDNCVSEKYSYVVTPLRRYAYYQWDELMQHTETSGDKGLCPPAWHIPTEAEWNTLFSFYLSIAFAGNPLKYSGYSGFDALLSGANHQNHTWNYPGFATFFWSSTPNGPYKAWAHGLNEYDPSVSTYSSSRANAFSVRCLKD